jgi:hypothetical protein
MDGERDENKINWVIEVDKYAIAAQSVSLATILDCLILNMLNLVSVGTASIS